MTTLASSQLIGANFTFQHHTFDACLDAMHKFGFTRIELWGIAPHLDVSRATGSDVTRLNRVLRAAKIGVRCLTPEQVAYPVNIASGDASWRDASIAHFLRAAEIAAELEADYLFLTPGRGYENAPAKDAWSRSSDALARIAARASELGLRCLLEPLQRVESNVANSAAELDELLGELPGDNFDVVLDTVAIAVAGDSVADYLSRFGNRLAHVHIVDGTPSGHLVWGDGTLPLGSVITELTQAKYAGTLTFEAIGAPSYALDPMGAWQRNLTAITPFMDRTEDAA